MHVTFVSLGQEYLGVEYLSAYLKREGHRTSLVHNPALFDDRFQLRVPLLARWFDEDDRIVAKILHLQPDLLAFSALTNTYRWCLEIARRVREIERIPIVFGGIHPSAVPDYVIARDEVDFVCQGEGETALLRLVDSLESGNGTCAIPNIWSKRGDGRPVPPASIARFVQDLDAMPFPDKDLYADTFRTKDIYNIMSGRGCPYRCTFCFNNSFAELPTNGRAVEYLRRRSVDDVMEELRLGKQKFGYRAVQFHDDIFTMNKPWLAEFLPRFKAEIGVAWTCETHAKFIDDELAELMSDTGCVFAQMGIQSMDVLRYKRNILKRNEREEDLIKAFDAFEKAGLHLAVDHIFGLPDESVGAAEQALEFYREHTPSRVSCYWLTYFPGVELTRYAHEKGYLSDEQLRGINEGELELYHELPSDPARKTEVDRFASYMVAFHLMPVVPRLLRRFVTPRLFSRNPLMVFSSKVVLLVKLVLDHWRTGNFIGTNYLKHYLFHMSGRSGHLDVPSAPEQKRRLPAFVSRRKDLPAQPR